MSKKETSIILQSKRKSSKPSLNDSGRTIPINSTHSSDIIECSIVGYENNYNHPKIAPTLISKKTVIDPQSDSLSGCSQSTRKKNSKRESLTESLRTSIKKSYGLVDTESKENYSPLQTPCLQKNCVESHMIMDQIISTIKKTPVPYLSKSKLQNIKQWLQNNDVETVVTPPFANLSVTPINLINLKKQHRKHLTSVKKKKENRTEESSIDSEIEDVLKAVYGDEWMQKNNAQSKTELKRKSDKNFPTESASKKGTTSTVKSVRRNILSSKKLNFLYKGDESVNLNDSNVSGVKVINLDDSNDNDGFIKTSKIASVQKKRKFDIETSSVESFNSSPTQKNKRLAAAPSDAVESRKNIRKITNNENLSARNSAKTPKKTFLASLSVSTPTSRCHPDAQYFKVNFKKKKDELVKKLFKLYNGEIFEGKLAEDMNFSWNIKLRGTAGYCYNKRITKSSGEIIRLSRIEFSTKIVDRADRLRDTMIHELCHAASWVVDGALDGHGTYWGSWAKKAMKRFPELPPIKRCHNYDIVSKYVYRCTRCGYTIKRHSKSIDIERKRCGHCYGVLELLLTKKKKGNGEVPEFDVTRTLRTPNKFALFVKENYHNVKNGKTNAKHAEIMKILSQQYALFKNGVKSGKKLLDK